MRPELRRAGPSGTCRTGGPLPSCRAGPIAAVCSPTSACGSLSDRRPAESSAGARGATAACSSAAAAAGCWPVAGLRRRTRRRRAAGLGSPHSVFSRLTTGLPPSSCLKRKSLRPGIFCISVCNCVSCELQALHLPGQVADLILELLHAHGELRLCRLLCATASSPGRTRPAVSNNGEGREPPAPLPSLGIDARSISVGVCRTTRAK